MVATGAIMCGCAGWLLVKQNGVVRRIGRLYHSHNATSGAGQIVPLASHALVENLLKRVDARQTDCDRFSAVTVFAGCCQVQFAKARRSALQTLQEVLITTAAVCIECSLFHMHACRSRECHSSGAAVMPSWVRICTASK